MQIPGTYPKGTFLRVKKQTRNASPIFSSQQERIIESFTGAELDTFLLTYDFAVQQITDVDGILPYTTLEFTFQTADLGLANTPYACHIIVNPTDTEGPLAVSAAAQINAWAATQGVQNPNLRSLNAIAKVVNFNWVIVIRMPWGMLGASVVHQYLPGYTGNYRALEAFGIDHPFLPGVRARNFHLLEIEPITPYRYVYNYGEAPYFYYQIG